MMEIALQTTDMLESLDLQSYLGEFLTKSNNLSEMLTDMASLIDILTQEEQD